MIAFFIIASICVAIWLATRVDVAHDRIEELERRLEAQTRNLARLRKQLEIR